jgi:hypothetical protein
MAFHAPPGAIHLTERTYRQLGEGFVLERRSKVVVKGKREMTTYIVLGRRSEPSVTGRRSDSPAPGVLDVPSLPSAE